MKDAETARAHSREYREARKAMGFKHMTCYIPENLRVPFLNYVATMAANHMLMIAETMDPKGPAVQALASRYYPPLPSRDQIANFRQSDQFKSLFVGDRARLGKSLDKVVEHLNQASSCQFTANNVTDSVEGDRFMALSIAHAHIAAAIWKEVMFEVTGK